MPLIIEDGSIVANANSYATIAEARDYATARGLELPALDDDLSALLIVGTDYTETKRDLYEGTKIDGNQSLQFPRNGVYIDGISIPGTVIPQVLKSAQIQLAVSKYAGISILPTSSEPFIKKEEVDGILTEYSEKVQTSEQPTLTEVDSLLSTLYKASAGMVITTVRI